jgi:hypothetical protein
MITEREEFAGKPTNGETQLPNGKPMTREDIIRMAREAGFADGVVDIVGFEGFTNFANLVAAHEREECAKVCEAEIERVRPLYSVTAENCTKVIRARE